MSTSDKITWGYILFIIGYTILAWFDPTPIMQ